MERALLALTLAVMTVSTVSAQEPTPPTSETETKPGDSQPVTPASSTPAAENPSTTTTATPTAPAGSTQEKSEPPKPKYELPAPRAVKPVRDPSTPEAIAIRNRSIKFMNDGMSLLEKGNDYNGAIKLFEKAMEADPTYVAPYVNRGMAYVQVHNYPAAIQDCTTAIDTGDPLLMPSALLNRGSARARSNDLTGAIEDYNKALTMRPKDNNIYINRAVARYRNGDAAGAVADCKHVLSVDPNNRIARDNLKLFGGKGEIGFADKSHLHTLTIDEELHKKRVGPKATAKLPAKVPARK